jgi:hypothetical protein
LLFRGVRVLELPLSNLLLPLLIGTTFVLLAAVAVRAGTGRLGGRVAVGTATTPAAISASRALIAAPPGCIVAGAFRAGRGDLQSTGLPVQSEEPRYAASPRAWVDHPGVLPTAAVLPGAMRPFLPPAIGRAAGSAAQSPGSVQWWLAPPG